MAITYTWKVTGIKTSSVQNTHNVIVQTYWEKTGTDGNYEGKFSGATPFDPLKVSKGSTFVPFEKLTEDIVLDWIKTVVVGSYEEHVNEQIQRQINDKKNSVVDAILPWIPVANTN